MSLILYNADLKKCYLYILYYLAPYLCLLLLSFMRDRLKNIKILIFGVKPQWEVSSLPSTNLADYLSKKKDYEVYYISDDLSFFHFFKWGPSRNFIKFIKSIFKRIKIKNAVILVTLYFSLVFQISIDFMTFFSYFNFKFRSKSLKKLLSEDFELVFFFL